MSDTNDKWDWNAADSPSAADLPDLWKPIPFEWDTPKSSSVTESSSEQPQPQDSPAPLHWDDSVVPSEGSFTPVESGSPTTSESLTPDLAQPKSLLQEAMDQMRPAGPASILPEGRDPRWTPGISALGTGGDPAFPVTPEQTSAVEPSATAEPVTKPADPGAPVTEKPAPPLAGPILSVPSKSSKPSSRRPLSSHLVMAIVLHLEGRADDALGELRAGIEEGGNPVELHTAMGNLQYELGRYADAAASYREVLKLEPENAGARFSLAVSLERTRQFADARDAFQEVLRANPADPDALLGMGIVLIGLDDYAGALNSFEKRLDLQPGNVHALFGKARTLEGLQRSAEAEQTYRDLLKLQPACHDALINLIALHRGTGHDDEALQYVGLLLRSFPSSESALTTLAGIELESDNFEAGASLCSRLVDANPKSFEGWFNLAVCCQAIKQTAKAKTAYAEAAKLRPSYFAAQLGLGLASVDDGDLTVARKAFAAAQEIAPQDDEESLWKLAVLADRLEETKPAEALYTRFVARHPESEDGNFRLGCLRMRLEDFAGAEAAFAAALKIRPIWPDAQHNQAVAIWKSGDADKARRRLEILAADQPRPVEALYCLAAIATSTEDYAGALAYYRQLWDLGERSVELSYNYGLLLQSHGRLEEAARNYREAVKERPHFTDALERLGQISLMLGREEDAKTYFRRAREAGPELIERQMAG